MTQFFLKINYNKNPDVKFETLSTIKAENKFFDNKLIKYSNISKQSQQMFSAVFYTSSWQINK